MKHIGNETFISKKEIKSESVRFIKEADLFNKEELFKDDAMMILMATAIISDFIMFIFKEGEKE